MSAILLKLLLIIAGVEQNPGPDIWFCLICRERIKRAQDSLATATGPLASLEHVVVHSPKTPALIPPTITISQSLVQTPPPGLNIVQSASPGPNIFHNRTPGHSRSQQLRWRCSVCQDVNGRNITSVQCNGCKDWCHMRRCSGLRLHKDWSHSFLAPCCVNNPPATVAIPVTPVQNTPRRTVLTHLNLPQLQQQPPAITPSQMPSILNIPQHRHPSRRQMQFGDSQQSFKIMQLNFNETKLTMDCRLSASGDYNIIRRDRERDHGGGLAFIIKRNINYTLT
ncbi:hypothetical protein FF38_01631 [Lucilia cuprina]|uniref:PHD-type domain-containing protein n=1 Tax=Lucilia cuprina TaxID=7375 RepID=A0A0L0BRK1_LUCCU|nr:hypothetical protein FF38_01631 [Lucilia cuprina]